MLISNPINPPAILVQIHMYRKEHLAKDQNTSINADSSPFFKAYLNSINLNGKAYKEYVHANMTGTDTFS